MKRYWIIVTEEELYAWVHCPAWTLPRKPISVVKPAAVGGRSVDDMLPPDFSVDSAVVAEYASECACRIGTAVPFYRVVAMFGLTDERTEILRDRYPDLGVTIGNFEQQGGVSAKRVLAALTAESRDGDLWRGATAMLELFDLKGSTETDAVVAESCRAVNGEAGQLKAIFDYSRADPWSCEGTLAAVCDLGKILRYRRTPEMDRVITDLATAVKPLLNSAPCDLARIRGLMNVFGDDAETCFTFVLFLHWKYAAERQGGRVDFAVLSETAREMEVASLGDVRKPLALFGAFSGFRSFAEEYHVKMRQRQTSPIRKEV